MAIASGIEEILQMSNPRALTFLPSATGTPTDCRLVVPCAAGRRPSEPSRRDQLAPGVWTGSHGRSTRCQARHEPQNVIVRSTDQSTHSFALSKLPLSRSVGTAMTDRVSHSRYFPSSFQSWSVDLSLCQFTVSAFQGHYCGSLSRSSIPLSSTKIRSAV